MTSAVCEEPATDGADGLCYFHAEHPQDRLEYAARLLTRLEQGNGDWRGFRIPGGLVLNAGRDPLSIVTPIDARSCIASGLSLRRVSFNSQVDFSQSTFAGPLVISDCIFQDRAEFTRCEFSESARVAAHFQGLASFAQSTFHRRFNCLGRFEQVANFSGCTFLDAAEFVGSIDVRLFPGAERPSESKRIGLFNGETLFSRVTFTHPERIHFRTVDLRRATFYGTDLDRVLFSDIDWYQAVLGRRGLYDEVAILDSANKDLQWPRLEATCRNVRRALEGGKDFNAASDFFVGEMDARRRQLPRLRRWVFSVEAMYNWLSRYGTSPSRAAGWLVALLLAHFAVTNIALVMHPESAPSSQFFLEAARRTISLLSIIRGPMLTPLPNWWFLLDAGTQVAVALQLAMFGLALRSRIKRG